MFLAQQSASSLAHAIHGWSKATLTDWGIASNYIDLVNLLLLSGYLLVLLLLIDFVIRKIILRNLLRLIEKSSTKFDDYLVANNAFVYLSRLVLLVVAKNLLPAILIDFQAWIGAGQKLLDVLLVLNWYLLFRALLRSVRDHLSTQPSFQDKPLGSYLQVANLVLVFVV